MQVIEPSLSFFFVHFSAVFERFEILYDQWPAAVKSDGQQHLTGKVVVHTSAVVNLRGKYSGTPQ